MVSPFSSRRIFDVDVCKTLTLMSSLVYERSEDLVMRASRIAEQIPGIPRGPNQQQQIDDAVELANTLLTASEQRIQVQVSYRFGARGERR